MGSAILRLRRSDPWCSGPTCQPVTLEIAGSNPVGSATSRIHPTPRSPARTGRHLVLRRRGLLTTGVLPSSGGRRWCVRGILRRVIGSLGSRLRLVLRQPDRSGRVAVAGEAVDLPEVDFVAYSTSERLSGRIRLDSARLTDMLNAHRRVRPRRRARRATARGRLDGRVRDPRPAPRAGARPGRRSARRPSPARADEDAPAGHALRPLPRRGPAPQRPGRGPAGRPAVARPHGAAHRRRRSCSASAPTSSRSRGARSSSIATSWSGCAGRAARRRRSTSVRCSPALGAALELRRMAAQADGPRPSRPTLAVIAHAVRTPNPGRSQGSASSTARPSLPGRTARCCSAISGPTSSRSSRPRVTPPAAGGRRGWGARPTAREPPRITSRSTATSAACGSIWRATTGARSSSLPPPRRGRRRRELPGRRIREARLLRRRAARAEPGARASRDQRLRHARSGRRQARLRLRDPGDGRSHVDHGRARRAADEGRRRDQRRRQRAVRRRRGARGAARTGPRRGRRRRAAAARAARGRASGSTCRSCRARSRSS